MQAQDESESNTGPLIQTFGKIRTVDHMNDIIENLDYKKIENQDPVLQKFGKSQIADFTEENDLLNSKNQRLYTMDDYNNEQSKEQNLNAMKEKESTLEKVQNITVNDAPTEISDVMKDEIIKQFLFQEMQKPSISSNNTRHEEKQKVLIDLLSNVQSNSDTNSETIEKAVEVKTDEGGIVKNVEKDEILGDNSNIQMLPSDVNLKKLDHTENESVEKSAESMTNEIRKTFTRANKEDDPKNNNRMFIPDTMNHLGGNLDHLLPSQDNKTSGVAELPLERKNDKTPEIVSKTLDSSLENTPKQEKTINSGQVTDEQAAVDKNKETLTIDSNAISDTQVVDNKEKFNEKSIYEAVRELNDLSANVIEPMKSHLESAPNDSETEKNSHLDNDDLGLQVTTIESNTIDPPNNNVNGKDDKPENSGHPSVENTSAKTLMVPKLMAVPNLNLNSPRSDDQNNEANDNILKSLSGLTIDDVRKMSDQDILEKIEENNTVNPDILDEVNQHPEMMKELLSAPQRIPFIDPVDTAGNATGANISNVNTPVANLLTHNPFENNVNETSNAESSPVDTRVLKSMSDAELQVALISLLASMNPAQTNQINLQPTGYGSFLAYIGDIDLNIELVPVQSNPLTRKKAKDMFKDVSKALGNIHSKLPPGTDKVVKAVISSTVPGGAEAIQAVELVAEVVKKQKEAKKNRNLTSDTENAEIDT